MANIKRIEGKRGVSYKITVTHGRDGAGKQMRHYKTWKPDKPMTEKQMEKAAQIVAIEFENSIILGFQPDNKQTFAEYAEYYFDILRMQGTKRTTMQTYYSTLRRINEEIGHIKIIDLRPQMITNFYKKLMQKGSKRAGVWALPTIDFNTIRGKRSLDRFASECGVTRETIKRVCTGQRVKCESADKISAALGMGNLFRLEGENNAVDITTVKACHKIINGVMKQAEKEMIIKYNPAERATLPKGEKKEVESLQPAQIQEILEALKKEPLEFETMITLYIVTGCRRGEIVALKWEKIDFESGEIIIDHSISYTKEAKIEYGTTKTRNTRRIYLPEQVLNLLKRHKAQQMERRLMMGDFWEDSGFVFTNWKGAPLLPNIVNRDLTLFCERNGFEHINPHKFRHTTASILIANGIDIITVSKMLGHCNASTTTNIYAHEIDKTKRKATECLSAVILKADNF